MGFDIGSNNTKIRMKSILNAVLPALVLLLVQIVNIEGRTVHKQSSQNPEYKRAQLQGDLHDMAYLLNSLPFEDYEDGSLNMYRNLAISRLVKRAMNTGSKNSANLEEPMFEPSHNLVSRSGSRGAELAALWKTRIG